MIFKSDDIVHASIIHRKSQQYSNVNCEPLPFKNVNYTLNDIIHWIEC